MTPPRDGGRDGERDPFAELADLGRPRPLPDSLRSRLEQTLLTSASADEVLPAGLDGPRPLPVALRVRLERALTARPANRWRVPVGIAAALVLLLGLSSLALVPRDGRGDSNLTATGPNATAPAEPAAGQPAESPLAATEQGADAATDATAVAGGAAAGSAGVPNNAKAVGPSSPRSSGPPPPFSSPSPAERSASSQDAAPAAASPSGGTSGGSPSSTSPPPSGPPLSIAVLGCTCPEAVGFRAYVDLVNHSGGINGHPLRLVNVTSAGGPTPGTIVTVNLTPTPLAESWGPRVEGLPALESGLKGNVFSFASPVERQAHLLVDEVFSSVSQGATAVIFHTPDDVFGRRVPDALESVLRARGVTVARVPYAPSQGRSAVPPTQTDAVFLSLETADDARSWFAEAERAGVSATRGVAGLYPLADESLTGVMPDGTRVISPYNFPAGQEASALRGATHQPLSAELVHGWATGKSMAVALWRSGATTRAQVADGLRGLTGYDSGLAPAYEVRRGTNVRTPEGLLFTKSQSVLAPRGGFRRDPH